MNIALGVIAIIVCTFAGYRLSAKYSERKKFYDSFAAFNKRLLYEVSFTKLSVVKLLNDWKDEKDPFTELLKDIFINKHNTVPSFKFLTQEENNYVKSYIDNIGMGDSRSQTIYLEGVEKHLESYLKSVSENEKKYKSLYIKLGFLTGLVIMVILL